VKVPATSFTLHTRVVAPFAGFAPQVGQSIGLSAGNGDQDNYVKFVVVGSGGAGGVELVREIGGVPTKTAENAPALLGAGSVDLYLLFDPASATVRPSYEITKGGVTQPRVWLAPQPIPASWLSTVIALGVISTSAGPGPEFPASWDLIEAMAGTGGVPAPPPPSLPPALPPAAPPAPQSSSPGRPPSAPPGPQASRPAPPAPPRTVPNARVGLSVFDFASVPRWPRAGRLLTVSLGVLRVDTRAIVHSGTIRCSATIAGRRLRAARRAFSGRRARCAWRMPSWARGFVVRGSIAVRQGSQVERRFSKLVRR
jgi:hypothetical protein